jgi:hypothetical protein
MKRVCVVCEGQTEEAFVLNVLTPAFLPLGINLIPEMIQTSPGHKGGALQYERVKRHLRNLLRQASAPTVTTLFDLYRLDSGFPGFTASQAQTDLAQRLQTLQQGLHQDIIVEAQCRPTRFIPFILPHEFEALLFSDIRTLTSFEQGWQRAHAALETVRMGAASPEHINDRPETKPAAHLERQLTHPRFRKTLHGPAVAQKIGLAKIEAECQFFAAWLAQLRALASVG